MSIPVYPEFKPLELKDKEVFDKVFSLTGPEICEYTFANLFAWREFYNLSSSFLDGFIVVMSGKNSMRYFLEPAGPGEKEAVIKKLLSAENVPFRYISESVKRNFENNPNYAVKTDESNSDYVYNFKDLIYLKGKKYDGKRNYIKRFKANYKYSYKALKKDIIPGALDFLEEWCKPKKCAERESLKYEKLAAREMFLNFEYLGLSGGVIEIEGKICAAAIGERLNRNTFVVHILKAIEKITGLNQVMNNEFLTNAAVGFDYINLEQDMGIEGLRKSKLSYHPVKMIPKYNILSV